jgi:hypothetical protein
VLAVDDEPAMTFTVGESIYATEIAEENKKRRVRFAKLMKLKRLRWLATASMKLTMSMLAMQSLQHTLEDLSSTTTTTTAEFHGSGNDDDAAVAP